MSGGSEEKKTIYRLVPCPAYDVEGMEGWLSDLAEQGLFLSRDGFFCGFGFFHQDTPRKVKYRLQASEIQGGFFSDNDEPEKEQQEISEALGWEYVARRGEFYIYRSLGEDVRELNTDPVVQELSLKMVQKRQHNAIFSCILWGMLYPLLKGRGALLVPMLYMKAWFYFFTAALIFWFFFSSVREAVYYAGLRKKLKNGTEFNRGKNWKKRFWQYPARIVLQIVLCCTWVFIVLGNLGRTVLFEDEIPLAEYKGNPPFATMADLAPGQFYELEKSSYFNTVIEWEDWFSDNNVLWEEYATVVTGNGTTRSGLWEVDYHELRYEWMAKQIALDYMQIDKERDFEFLYELELGLDYAVAYLDDIHMPRVILRNGNKVLRGSFHEYYNEQSEKMTIEEWAGLLAESIK